MLGDYNVLRLCSTADFMLPSTFSLTPTSSAMSVQCVSLNITNDQVRENEESFFLAVANSTYIEAPGFPLQVVIEDDDSTLICLIVMLLLLLYCQISVPHAITATSKLSANVFTTATNINMPHPSFMRLELMFMILFPFPTRCPSVLSVNCILSS